jgi:hypothetical protein
MNNAVLEVERVEGARTGVGIKSFLGFLDWSIKTKVLTRADDGWRCKENRLSSIKRAMKNDGCLRGPLYEKREREEINED